MLSVVSGIRSTRLYLTDAKQRPNQDGHPDQFSASTPSRVCTAACCRKKSCDHLVPKCSCSSPEGFIPGAPEPPRRTVPNEVELSYVVAMTLACSHLNKDRFRSSLCCLTNCFSSLPAWTKRGKGGNIQRPSQYQ